MSQVVEKLFCEASRIGYALLSSWRTRLWDTGGSTQHWMTTREIPLMNWAPPLHCPSSAAAEVVLALLK